MDAPDDRASGPRRFNTLLDFWLGQRIRELRKQRGWSLQGLASETGISVGTLSQVERGITSASIKTLDRLARVLEVPVGELLGNLENPTGDVGGWVARAQTHRRLESRDHRILKEVMTPQRCAGMDLYQARIQPGGTSSDERYSTLVGEIAGVVVAGSLELWIDDQHVVLQAGDCFCYQGDTPRRWGNPGQEVTHVIWCVLRL